MSATPLLARSIPRFTVGCPQATALHVTRFGAGPHAGWTATLDEWLVADRARGFDLGAPPLMRVTLIRTTGDEWRLVWTRHHLLLDGWSTARLFADVLRDYIEPPRAQPFAVPAKARYRDFIAWLAARDIDAEHEFWRGRLAHLDEPTRVAQREAGTHAEHRTWRASFDPDASACSVFPRLAA